MINKFIISVLLIVMYFTVSGQLNINKFSSKISFSLPDTNTWTIVTDELGENRTNGLLMFRHKPIIDSKEMPVEPVLAIVYEEVKQKLDVIEYSVDVLGQKFYNINHVLLGGYPEFSSDKHSVVYSGNFLKDNVKHKVILGYILYNNIGIEIIGDSTDDIYLKVESDIKKFIKSVNIKD